MRKHLSKIMLVVLAVFIIGITIPENASAVSLETTGAVKMNIHMRKLFSLQEHPLYLKVLVKTLKLHKKNLKES